MTPDSSTVLINKLQFCHKTVNVHVKLTLSKRVIQPYLCGSALWWIVPLTAQPRNNRAPSHTVENQYDSFVVQMHCENPMVTLIKHTVDMPSANIVVREVIESILIQNFNWSCDPNFWPFYPKMGMSVTRSRENNSTKF